MNFRIRLALTEICDLERPRQVTVGYLEKQSIDITKVAGFYGSPTVVPITLLPNNRFDLPDHGAEAVEGVVIEAHNEDGETVVDLVAWLVADPFDVRTLLGRVSMVGLWAALNPGTYIFNYPLVMHRSPLAWLRANCEGAAVVIPKLAARTFLEITDMGGRLGAQDAAHACELQKMLLALVGQVEIVIPKMRAAA